MITIISTPLITILQNQVLVDDLIVSPTFFVTILAGVILALAFQFILTAISIAGGITAIGDVKKNYVESKVRPSDNSTENDAVFDQDYSSGISMGVKITSAFGLWSVVTTCIALFGATALALNLNTIESEIINTVTALVIWALFFLILFYLEAKVARTLIGNLISAATSGLRSSADMLTSFFASSPESKVEDIIGTTIDKVRKEFDSGFNSDKLSNVLDNFLSKVDNRIPNYEELRTDFENIAKSSQNKKSSGKWMAMQQVVTKAISDHSESGDTEKKGKAQKLKELYDSVVSSYNASEGSTEGIKNVIEEFTPMEREEIDGRIKQMKEFLETSTSENLNGDNLKNSIKNILNDPMVVRSMISENFKDLDRNKIITFLNANTNLEKDDLNSYADTIEGMIQRFVKEFDKENQDRFVKQMELKVSNFFNGSGRKELDYSLLKNDIKRVMDDPKDSLNVIKNRFSTFDHDTLRAVVTNNKYINEEHIDKVLETIDSSKNEVLDKISQIQAKANQQLEITKRKAVIQAEHARATAVSAAWWLVLSTVLSAVAALLGSFVAL